MKKETQNKMQACLYYGLEKIALDKTTIPSIKSDEVLVKVDTAIINGSSYKTYLRGHPVLINKKLPSPFGHQFSGIVEKTGSKVKNFKRGDRVTALNSSPCYKCESCLENKLSLCENLIFMNGAFAEFVKIPSQIVKNNLYKIPKKLSLEKAALTETLAVVLHGISRSEITPRKTVCVIGTGAIGLLFVAVLKMKRIKVIALGRSEDKLKLARKLGAYKTISLRTNYKKVLRKITKNQGPDVVIEAVGKPETWEMAVDIVKKGGLINFFGGCEKGSKVQLDTYRMHYEELKLIGVFHHTPVFVKEAIKMLSMGLKSIENVLITNRYPLSEIQNAFNEMKSKSAIQIAIKP